MANIHEPGDVELLAPAGDLDCIRAAVENGADAVYFGLDHGFNARARAANMSVDHLPEIMHSLHRRAVRGYVTLNTLVFSDELDEAENTIRQVAAAGVDAVLVQDLGVVRLIRAVCPELPIHASTQMTLSSAECIAAIEELGIERVVLPRELSIDEIRQIHQRTKMSLEAFVHGALCVAYSGQCLTSESLGGRSANRGQCAQACRLPYDLLCDGQDVDLGPVKYLLSPQDLAAYDLIPQMLEAGVRSFKIEGRLKTAEYVANITKHYREALDTALAGRPVQLAQQDVEAMELSFSRGFSPGWLSGCDHKMLVPGLSSAKRGVRLGEVTSLDGPRVTVRLQASVSRGDGVVFDGDRASGDEQGGRVFAVYRGRQRMEQPASAGLVELTFDRNAVDVNRLYPGQQIWKTDDPQLTARLRRTFAGPDAIRRVPVDLTVTAAVDAPLVVEARAENGCRAVAQSEQPLEAAQRHPLDEPLLRKQLGRLGGTVYELRHLTATITGSPMVPLSVLGQVRHALIAQLNQPPAISARQVASESVLPALREKRPTPLDSLTSEARVPPQLHVLCRSLEQLRDVLATGANSVSVDFADIRQYREAVSECHAAQARVLIATPRIQKPGEVGIFKALQKHGADGVLVRNLAGLQFFARLGVPVVADFSLNAANELTVQLLREQGATRVTASYDLNREQLLGLVEAVPAAWLEVVVHQHMPMFHMEHCVFCAVLSPGTNKTNCGRPCDVHQVQLRDRIGMLHPLTADVGCRNTLFNAVPQSSAEVVPVLCERGVRHFRVELLDDRGPAVERTLRLYRDLLAGTIRGVDVWRQLRASNRVGVTRGTLDERRNPLAIL